MSIILASSEPDVVENVTESAQETAETMADSAVTQLQSLADLFSVFKLDNLLVVGVRLLVVLIVLGLAYRVIRMLINRAYATRYRYGNVTEETHKQLETARRMMVSIVFYVMIIIGAIAVMSIFGFDVRAIAASAGIAGAALVFISQNVILDWINGVFILVERQFSVGDYVKLGEYTGEVQSITIRHTVLKTDFGEIVSVPNGDINVVVNYSQNPVTEFFDVRLYDAARIEEGRQALEDVCALVNVRYEETLTTPCHVLGVQELVGSGLTFRVSFQSKKNDTYAILRALRAESVRVFHSRNLSYIPNHQSEKG